jgi:hypothetical protein
VAETSIARDLGGHEELLYAIYFLAHAYEDGATDGEPVVTALFREPTANGGSGYAIREYFMGRGGMFYRFPEEDGHWSRAIIREEWYRETESRLPQGVFGGL